MPGMRLWALVISLLAVVLVAPAWAETYADRRRMLLELLQAAGYCVPVE